MSPRQRFTWQNAVNCDTGGFCMEVWRKIDTRALLRDMKRLQKDLDTNGPSAKWDDEKRFLFRCVDTYNAFLKVDDMIPKYSMRIPEFKHASPATKQERANIAEASKLKKQVLRQMRELKAKGVFW